MTDKQLRRMGDKLIQFAAELDGWTKDSSLPWDIRVSAVKGGAGLLELAQAVLRNTRQIK